MLSGRCASVGSPRANRFLLTDETKSGSEAPCDGRPTRPVTSPEATPGAEPGEHHNLSSCGPTTCGTGHKGLMLCGTGSMDYCPHDPPTDKKKMMDASWDPQLSARDSLEGSEPHLGNQ